MTTLYTSGPWKAKGRFAYDSEEKCNGMFTIMTDTHGTIGCFDKKEDRDLAAAAPELLESLQEVIRICEAMRFTVGLGKNQLERIERAKGRIAKAKGGAA